MTEFLRIIIPFYNVESTIERTVLSLRSISPVNRRRVRVIAVDDGSTDRSCTIFLAAISRVDGLRHDLLQKDNGGSGSARNAGLSTFDCGWTLFLDADDELVRDPVPFLIAGKEKSALLFATEFARNGSFLHLMRLPRQVGKNFSILLTAGNPFTVESVVFRRELVKNLFNEELIYMEDWCFWAVNPEVFADCMSYPGEPLGRVNVRAASKSSDLVKHGMFRIAAAHKIRVFWGDRIGTMERNNLRLQEEIGKLQIGGKGSLSTFFRFPVSLSLYGKYLIYMFLYPLYRRFQPYRDY